MSVAYHGKRAETYFKDDISKKKRKSSVWIDINAHDWGIEKTYKAKVKECNSERIQYIWLEHRQTLKS